MVTMARSKKLTGPYESHPGNPVLTNANTTSLCETDQCPQSSRVDTHCHIVQTVGHSDLFQDGNGNW